MEKLNINNLKILLRYLNVSSSGTKADLLSRLQVVLMEREVTFDEVVAEALKRSHREHSDEDNKSRSSHGSRAETNKSSGVGNGNSVRGVNKIEDVSPDDSVSQVGRERKEDGECSSVSKRASEGSHVSRSGRRMGSVVSRGESFMTSVSALEKRRELEVKRAVQIAKDTKLEHIEKLKEKHRKETVEAKIRLEEEKRKKEREIEEDGRNLELQEQLQEMELAAEIRMLERESREEALRVEADAWAKFEEFDIGAVRKIETPLQRLNIEEILSKQSFKKDKFNLRDRKASNRKCTEENVLAAMGGNCAEGKREFKEDFGDDRGVFGERTIRKTPRSKDALLRELIASNIRIGLPKHEIEYFSGDVTQYAIFKGSMQEINRSETLSYEEKLHYIYQYTRGEPRELVKAALYMAPQKGFEAIWRWYDEKYGAPEKIGAEFVDSLLSRPMITRDDVEGLKSFAVALRLTMNVMDRIPYGQSELEHPKTIRSLVSKLPYSLQEKWRNMSAERKYEQGEYLGYESLVSFIERVARIDSDPLFGKPVMQRASEEQMGRASGTRRRIPVHVISGESDQKDKVRKERENQSSDINPDEREYSRREICIFCKGSHIVEYCNRFRRLSNDRRYEVIKGIRACFICLKIGHGAGKCPVPRKCGKCSRYHHSLLHVDGEHENIKGPEKPLSSNITWREYSHKEGLRSNCDFRADAPEFVPRKEESVPIGSVSIGACTEVGSMAVMPVVVKDNRGNETITSAFLDQGSAVSFCTLRLLERLEVKLDDMAEVDLCTETLHDRRRERTILVSGLMVRGMNEDEWLSLPPIYTVKKIPISVEDVWREKVQGWEHLKGIAVPPPGDIDLMLGMNALGALEPLEVRPSPKIGDPYAMRTRLGWCIVGLLGNREGIRTAAVNKVRINRGEISSLINEAFERGFEGLNDDKLGLSGEDEKWLTIVEEGCRNVDGHYEIPLPLREIEQGLPDSRGAAIRRAFGLKKKLEKDAELRRHYEECVNDMITKGYAEKVTDETRGKWYLAHFSVRHPSKPEKVRVVFDCASRVASIALNDILLQGPDLATQLLDVLLRFRVGKFAFTADVNAMFHQVRVPVEHRDFLRFFWWEGGVVDGVMGEYRMAVHLFGATSSPSVANYALRRIADDTGKNLSVSASRALRENFYVDDCLCAGSDHQSLHRTASDLRELCKYGGFNLRKFSSNVGEIERDLEKSIAMVTTQKVLGVVWDKIKDELGVPQLDLKGEVHTKRELLSAIAKVYDPLGIVAPLVLQGRLIFQEIIRRDGIGDWDEGLMQVDCDKVKCWLAGLDAIEDMKAQRNLVGSDELMEVQLHIFGDASELGHAAVAYARLLLKNGKKRCVFILGKSKVNPTKYVSVPRLELVASTLAARLSSKIREALGIKFAKVFMWTDSVTVLRYIRNDRIRFHSFVANRVSEIKRRTEISDWHYVETSSNPADDGSRGLCTNRWREGPKFLLEEESLWRMERIEEANDSEDPEIKGVSVLLTGTWTCFLSKMAERYSNWRRLIRAVSWLTRFKDYIAKGRHKRDWTILSASERGNAEMSIIRAVQKECFGDEYDRLEKGDHIRKDSRLVKLCIFLENGVLRVGGRLNRAALPYDSIHPILLPSTHRVTELLVQEIHSRAGHLGVSTVLGWTREKYWIVKGYSTIRRIIGQCFVCRRVQGQPLQQRMAELPSPRVIEGEPAFTCVGVDCFGPYYTTMGRGRQQIKRYGVIFTCMAVRAVHLEVAQDLSSDSILRAIRRFMARRGRVKLFCSDNGTNFTGARRDLLKSLGADDVRNEIGDQGVRWEFNPPKASHFGGIWERIIRLVRRVLEAFMVGKTFTDDSLSTLFCEAEAAINSRPLTTVGEDPNEEALTPQRLLNLGTSMEYHGEIPSEIPDLVKKWHHVQAMAQQFWHRWCREYRSSLQGRSKWVDMKRNVAKGDIVMIIDEQEARCHWPLGRVVEVKRSADGLVRSVVIYSRGKKYVRPVAKLVMMIEGEELP